MYKPNFSTKISQLVNRQKIFFSTLPQSTSLTNNQSTWQSSTSQLQHSPKLLSTSDVNYFSNNQSVRFLSTSPLRKYTWYNNNFQGDVTLVSFNVLSQKHLEEHKYLYQGVNPKCMDWDYRERTLREKFYNFIQGDGVSIFCLQEVDQSKLKSFYRPFFKDYGYKMIYYQRPSIDRTKPHHLKKQITSYPDGCAIVYDARRFSPVETDFVNFNYKDEEGGAEAWQPGMKNNVNLNYSNIAILQKFKSKKNGKKFVIGNTHLAFNPNLGDLKLCQLMMLLYKVQKFTVHKDTKKVIPTILTGDFNIHATSKIFQEFIMNGKFDLREQNCSTLSGQLNSSNNNKCVKIPILPAKLGIDYTNMEDVEEYLDEFDLRGYQGTERAGLGLQGNETENERSREYRQARKMDEHYMPDPKKRERRNWNRSDADKVKDLKKLRETAKRTTEGFRDTIYDNVSYDSYHRYNTKSLTNNPYTVNMSIEYVNAGHDIYRHNIIPFIGHSLYLKMPYVSVFDKSSSYEKPFTTYLKRLDKSLGKLLVDQVICSETTPIYNYMKTPLTSSSNDNDTLLGFDNPSDHVPIGINFDIPETE